MDDGFSFQRVFVPVIILWTPQIEAAMAANCSFVAMKALSHHGDR